MLPRVSPRFSSSLVLALIVVGCAAAPQPPVPSELPEKSRVVKNGGARLKVGNQGRLLGTIVATPEMLSWAGVTDLSGAKAQAFDQDGLPVSVPVSVTAEGNFVIDGVRESRATIFVEADVNGLRFRTIAPAPRLRADYGVVLDAGTTFLADKMRRSALDTELLLDKLDKLKLAETEDLVNVYLEDSERREVLEEDDADLNAYAFDHFMDKNIAVKVAVYQLAPSVLRGWEPNLPRLEPSRRPATPTPTPIDIPTGPEPTAQPVPSVDPDAPPGK